MRTFLSTSLVTVLLVLLQFLQLGSALGVAAVRHYCPFDVWCAVVPGYHVTTPVSEREGVNWKKLPPYVENKADTYIQANFDYAGPSGDVGVAMMLVLHFGCSAMHLLLTEANDYRCTRDKTASPVLATQLEFTWEKDQGQGLIYWDASNVAGRPFLEYGYYTNATDDKDPGLTLNNCHGAVCQPNDTDCDQVYESWNDDVRAMRACFDDARIGLTLCRTSAPPGEQA